MILNIVYYLDRERRGIEYDIYLSSRTHNHLMNAMLENKEKKPRVEEMRLLCNRL